LAQVKLFYTPFHRC